MGMKKNLEGEINELEIAVDHANKANNEAQKAIKRYQGQLRDSGCNYEEEQRQRQEVAEKASVARDRRRPSWQSRALPSSRNPKKDRSLPRPRCLSRSKNLDLALTHGPEYRFPSRNVSQLQR